MNKIIKSEDGFTLFEMVLVVAGISWVAFCGWLMYLIVKALCKYIGS